MKKTKANSHKKDQKPVIKSNKITDIISKYSIYFIFASLFMLLLVLIKTAWLCDDAFITFRTIDNFVNGYGLRFNVVERVQAYTHPLWLFVLTIPYFFFHEPFYTPIIVSILFTLASILILIFKISSSRFNSFLLVIAAIISKAFIDYSTSGLENPLSFLIAALFIYFFFKLDTGKKKLLILSLVSSLALLNRMDSILFYLPALIYLVIESKEKKQILTIFLGWIPFIIWTIFSLIYYGYPFPNTYYAKLNTGVPKIELFSQSFYYFFNSLKLDPFTLITIFACLVFVLLKRDKKILFLGLGIFLYLLYIVYIGGDFMSGRFFSLPFFISLTILSSSVSLKNISLKASLLVVLLALVFLSPNPPVFAGINYSDNNANFIEEHGVSDERGFYYQNASLWKAMNGENMPNHQSLKSARNLLATNEKIFLAGAIGFFGYYAGPSIYVIDVYSLADPLLSKYHVVKYDPIFGGAYEKVKKVKSSRTWRIGHFLRPIPPGYTLSILKNEPVIDDPKFNELYKIVRVITQGDIFSSDRFWAIWKMNTGQYDYLIDHERYTEYIETNFHDDLIRFQPNDPRYSYSRGTFYFKRKNYKKAIPDFEKSLILDRYQGLAWYKLAISQFFEKKYDKAVHALENAKNLKEEVDPEFEKVLFQKMREEQASKTN